MYNTMKKLSVLMLMLFMLCGCSRAGGVTVNTSTAEYETDISQVCVQGVEIDGLENVEFQEEINKNIASDLDSAMVSFDTAASENASALRMGNRCILHITQTVMNNSDNFLSVVEEHYVYLGGAHGTTAWYPRNFDFASSKKLVLSDLFSDDGYADTLNRIITEMVDNDKEQYADLWEHPVIKEEHETDFYIKDGRIVIFYQPYDLSYYARGFVEFPIKLSDLSGYLKEEYKRLIK